MAQPQPPTGRYAAVTANTMAAASWEPGFAAGLTAAAGGDERAFESLIGPILPRLDGYLSAQARQDADDLRSDVLLAVYRSLARFRGTETQFRSWVFTIAHHRIVDHRRRARPVGSLDDLPESVAVATGPGPEDAALAGARAAELREILNTLPFAQRQVMLLRTVADLSLEQTAEAIGKSVGAVKLLQHRAVVTLRVRLTEISGEA